MRIFTSRFIYIYVRGCAPIGMVEFWNVGMMGLGILPYWVNGKIRDYHKVLDR
jgi:hypothetical protein